MHIPSVFVYLSTLLVTCPGMALLFQSLLFSVFFFHSSLSTFSITFEEGVGILQVLLLTRMSLRFLCLFIAIVGGLSQILLSSESALM